MIVGHNENGDLVERGFKRTTQTVDGNSFEYDEKDLFIADLIDSIRNNLPLVEANSLLISNGITPDELKMYETITLNERW